MSAVNIIRQTNAVHIVADTAMFDREARLFASLSQMHILEQSQCVVYFFGKGISDVPPYMHNADTDYLLDNIGAMFRISRRALVAEGDPSCELGCVLAGWSEKRNALGAWRVASTADIAPDLFSSVQDFEPFRVYDAPFDGPFVVTSPGVSLSQTIGRIETYEEFDALDAEAVGLAILNVQRHTAWNSDGQFVHVVGGAAEIAIVTRDGATKRTIAEWPDEIGKRIDPGPMPKKPTRACRNHLH